MFVSPCSGLGGHGAISSGTGASGGNHPGSHRADVTKKDGSEFQP